MQKVIDWVEIPVSDLPRESYPNGAPLQAFTALGFIRTGAVYEYDMTPDGVPGFVPWRIDVDYRPVRPVLIKPLIAQLDFITDKTHWGVFFRFGQLGVSKIDFDTIAQAMSVPV